MKLKIKLLTKYFVAALLLIAISIIFIICGNEATRVEKLNQHYCDSTIHADVVKVDDIYFLKDDKPININEIAKSHTISNYEVDKYCEDVIIDDDIEVIVFPDGEVRFIALHNARDHSFEIWGLNNDSTYYDVAKVFGYYYYDDKVNDIVSSGIKNVASSRIRYLIDYNGLNVNRTKKIEIFGPVYGYGDCDVEIGFAEGNIYRLEFQPAGDF